MFTNSRDILLTPIEYLKGVGPLKGDLLRKELQINTFGDMLTHYPFRYLDRSSFTKIKDIPEGGGNGTTDRENYVQRNHWQWQGTTAQRYL